MPLPRDTNLTKHIPRQLQWELDTSEKAAVYGKTMESICPFVIFMVSIVVYLY